MAHILDIKRNSLDDGPGIRTAIFFKGCPLSCLWCHNPESKSPKPQLRFDRDACIACRSCIDACNDKAIDHGRVDPVDRETCTLCFSCTDVCPACALQQAGTSMSVADIMKVLEKDLAFFANSGGGVTLTGGEPTTQMNCCVELLEACRKKGIHSLLETCGLFDFKRFKKEMAPLLNVVYIDLKLIDTQEHRRYCGVDNIGILDNLLKLAKLSREYGLPVLPRVPLVPGITDAQANLHGIADFLLDCGYESVSLLPYNPTWPDKARAIGQSPAYVHDSFMSDMELKLCQSYFGNFKLV